MGTCNACGVLSVSYRPRRLLIVALTVIGCVVAFQWRIIRQADIEAAFKADLLAQGTLIAEIATRLSATPATQKGLLGANGTGGDGTAKARR